MRVETGYQDGDVEEGMMPAGQAVQQLRSIQPAGDIVREVVADAESILRAAVGRSLSEGGPVAGGCPPGGRAGGGDGVERSR